MSENYRDKIMRKADEIVEAAAERVERDERKTWQDKPSGGLTNNLSEDRIGEFKNIPDHFEPFAKIPDPEAQDNTIEQLRNIAGGDDFSGLTSVKQQADKVQETVGDYWNSDAGLAFTDFFSPMAAAVPDNQMETAKMLAGALEANKGILHALRQDVDKIADATVATLESDGMFDLGTTANTPLSMVIAASTIAGALVATSPVAAGAGIVGGLAIGANAFVVEKDDADTPGDVINDSALSQEAKGSAKEEVEAQIDQAPDSVEMEGVGLDLSGGSAEAIIDSMIEALEMLKSICDSVQQDLGDALDSLLDDGLKGPINTNGDGGRADHYAPRPNFFVDGSQSESAFDPKPETGQ